jgi:hypothetical protein
VDFPDTLNAPDCLHRIHGGGDLLFFAIILCGIKFKKEGVVVSRGRDCAIWIDEKKDFDE